MGTCAYCGNEGHRSIRCQFGRRTDWIAVALYLGWAAVVIVLAVVLAGCAMQPDTLCQTRRPVAAINDTADTRASQAKAAKLWDSRCTVRGWVSR